MAPNPRRQYLVMRRTERRLPEVGGRKFGTTGTFIVNDKGEAEAIDQRWGTSAKGDERNTVRVVPFADRRPQRQHGYKVIFTVPELPWHTKRRKNG